MYENSDNKTGSGKMFVIKIFFIDTKLSNSWNKFYCKRNNKVNGLVISG